MQRVPRYALALAVTLPLSALAQNSTDLQAQIEQLQHKVKQLEEKAVHDDSADVEARTEFQRVRSKAETTDQQLEDSGLKGFKISGFLDPTYITSQRQHTSSFILMKRYGDRNGDGSAPGAAGVYNYDNGLFGTAMLRFEKEVEGGTKFLLELMPAKSYADATGYNEGSLVHQAYVTIPSGIGKDKFYAGQVGAWTGYEFSLPNQKKTITDNLFYDFTEAASFITGVGYEHYEGVAWDFKAAVGNLNNGRVTDRRAPALHWRLDYIPGEYWGLGISGVHGKTGADMSVNYIAMDGFFTRGDWNVQGQLEAGRSKGMAFDGRNSAWRGIGGLVSYKLTPQWEAVLRATHIHNSQNGGGTPNLLSGGECATADGATACGDYRNGFGPGIDNATGLIADPNTGANRSELTLALDYVPTANTTIKAEVRRDFATQNVFYDVRSQRYEKNNLLLGLALVFSF